MKLVLQHISTGETKTFHGDADNLVAAIAWLFPWLTRFGPLSGGDLQKVVAAIRGTGAYRIEISGDDSGS